MDSTTIIEALVAQRVTDALAYYEANKNTGSRHGGGTRNGGGSSIHDDNRGPKRACTYKYLVTYKPKSFYGNKGVVRLTRSIDMIELVFK